MLTDSITLTSGAKAVGLAPSSGATFPLTPVDGQLFRLTATAGGYGPGSYWYDEANDRWSTGDITGVTVGDGLTGGGSYGALVLGLDLTYLDARYGGEGTVYTGGAGITLTGTAFSLDLTYADARYVNANGDTLTGALTLSADPVNPLHAATKQYVDSVAQGLDPKASVRCATTGNITLSGLQTIDGVTVIAGNRVLAKLQTGGINNGIWVAAAGAWSRAADADSSAEVTPGMYCFVEEGTVNGATGWNLTTTNVNLGVTPLTFTQFGAAVAYTAGTNVSIVGTVISVPNANMPYDIAGSILSKPAASAVVMRFVAVRAFTLPAGLTGSLSKSATAATASTVFSLQKNGAQFGTMTYAAAGTTGTFAAAAQTSFAIGDILTVVAPASADATFNDCEFTLIASLT